MIHNLSLQRPILNPMLIQWFMAIPFSIALVVLGEEDIHRNQRSLQNNKDEKYIIIININANV